MGPEVRSCCYFGLIVVKRISILFVFLVAFSSPATSHEVAYSQEAWPEKIDCSQCAVMELLDLQLSIPFHMLKRLKMLNMDGIAFSLEADNQWLKTEEELIVLLLSESDVTGGLSENGYYEKLRVSSLDNFFKVLHQKGPVTEELQIARKVMGLEGSLDFVAYYGDALSAFWVISDDRKNQSLYIVPVGKNYSLQISGYLTHAIVDALLSYVEIMENED